MLVISRVKTCILLRMHVMYAALIPFWPGMGCVFGDNKGTICTYFHLFSGNSTISLFVWAIRGTTQGQYEGQYGGQYEGQYQTGRTPNRGTIALLSLLLPRDNSGRTGPYTKVILMCSHRLTYYIARFSEYSACLSEV